MPNEQEEPGSIKPGTRFLGFWIAIGAALGAGLGVVFDSLPIGVAIGIALGVAIGTAQAQRNKNK